MQTWLPGELVEGVGWTLLHFLWQGLAIGALLAIALRLLRHHSANQRYLAGCVALICVVVAPVVTLSRVMPHALAQDVASLTPASTPSDLPILEPGETEAHPAVSVVVVAKLKPVPYNLSQSLRTALPWFVLAWLAGVILLSARLCFGWWRVNRMRRAAGIPLADPWPARITILLRKLDIARPLRVVQSALVEVPTVIGWLRPIVLLPASSIIGLTPAQLEAVLAHELAHVRRHDYLVNLLQNVVETILFYHPMVWWISRCIREERENCCDDLAVKVCGDPANYARALATLEELRPAPAQLSLAASGAPLLNRIKRLLSPPDRTNRPAWPFAGIMVLLLLVGVASCVRGHRTTIANANTAPSVASTNAAVQTVNNQTNQAPLATLVKEGKLRYEEGRLDEAERKLNAALQLDPSSVAAHYYLSLTSEKRAEQLTNRVKMVSGRHPIISKLDRIRVDEVKSDRLPLPEIIRVLNEKAREFDPDKVGINFLIDRDGVASQIDLVTHLPIVPYQTPDITAVDVTIDPALKNVRLSDLLEAIVMGADYPIKYEVRDYAIAFKLRPANESPKLEIRTFHVAKADMAMLPKLTSTPEFTNSIQSNLKVLIDITNALEQVKAFLGIAGVDLNTTNQSGRTFIYSDRKGVLTVRATAEELDRVATLVDKLKFKRAEEESKVQPDAPQPPNAPASTNSIVPTTSAHTPIYFTNYTRYQDLKSETEATYGRKQALFDQLKNLAPPELRQALPTAIPDAIFSRMLHDLVSVKTRLTWLLSNRGPQDPEVRRTNLLLADLDKEIDTRATALLQGLRTEVIVSENTLHNVDRKIQERSAEITTKLDQIRLTCPSFANTPLPEVVAKIRDLSSISDPEKKGVNMVVDYMALSAVHVTIAGPLPDMRLKDVLELVIKSTDQPVKYSILDYGVMFSLNLPEPPPVEIRTYYFDMVPFRKKLQALADEASKSGTKQTNLTDIGLFLADAGVDPRVMGAYHENHGTLTARGSKDELDRLGKALDPFSRKDTRIRFKIVVAEVPVNQSSAISPNITVGYDPVPGEPGTSMITEFIAIGTNAFSPNPVSSRSVLSTNSSPLLTGLMSPGQLKVALQQFEQREGVDVLTTPEVIDFDRQTARIEVSTGQTVVVGTANAPAPLMVFTGISLGLVPHLQADGTAIEIEATPALTEFLGYDKPSPSATGPGGKSRGPTPLPHFRVIEMKTKAVVGDGQTLVLEGPSMDIVTKMASKVPVLGDLPLISPLFRSKSSKTVTKHLVIFITPTIVGSDGTPRSW